MDECQLVTVTGRRQLCIVMCFVLRRSYTFAVADPRVWNSLSVHIRQPVLTLGKFYRSLKTQRPQLLRPRGHGFGFGIGLEHLASFTITNRDSSAYSESVAFSVLTISTLTSSLTCGTRLPLPASLRIPLV